MACLEAADELRDLQRSEHLVLFGFRMMALGRGDCPALHGAYRGLLGEDGDSALCSLLAFVRSVGWCGRRKVRLHAPGCGQLSDDERCVVAVIAAAQDALFDGAEATLRERMAELLGGEADEGCLMAAQSVAAALTCHGLQLPERSAVLDVAPPWTAALAGTSTLH